MSCWDRQRLADAVSEAEMHEREFAGARIDPLQAIAALDLHELSDRRQRLVKLSCRAREPFRILIRDDRQRVQVSLIGCLPGRRRRAYDTRE
jgi:hypothetical protein